MTHDMVLAKNEADLRETLLSYLKTHSYKEGEFTLASERKSKFFIDCKRTLSLPYGLLTATCLLSKEVMGMDIDAIAGEGVGGIILATATVSHLAMLGKYYPLVIVRKKTKGHGSKKCVERCEKVVPTGSRIVLIEDVLTTGGSVIRAANELREVNLVLQT